MLFRASQEYKNEWAIPDKGAAIYTKADWGNLTVKAWQAEGKLFAVLPWGLSLLSLKIK